MYKYVRLKDDKYYFYTDTMTNDLKFASYIQMSLEEYHKQMVKLFNGYLVDTNDPALGLRKLYDKALYFRTLKDAENATEWIESYKVMIKISPAGPVFKQETWFVKKAL